MIKILCVGKIKENFYRQAIDEYAKRLSKYCKLEIIEVADEKTRIFKIGKERKAYDNGNYHKDFSCFRRFRLIHQKRKSPSGKNRSRHKENINRFAPGIENKAVGKKNRVFKLFGHRKIGY